MTASETRLIRRFARRETGPLEVHTAAGTRIVGVVLGLQTDLWDRPTSVTLAPVPGEMVRIDLDTVLRVVRP